jgi:hypothetical protein
VRSTYASVDIAVSIIAEEKKIFMIPPIFDKIVNICKSGSTEGLSADS